MVSEMDKKLYARTLYVSDLDGTLLRSNERTSQYTNETINRLSQQGGTPEDIYGGDSGGSASAGPAAETYRMC